MKKLVKRIKIMMFTSLAVFSLSAQSQTKQTAAVLNIDSHVGETNSVQMGNIVRLELMKLNYFNVIDKYDAEYLIQKNQLQIDKCFGRMCLVEVGKVLQVDKMIGGSFETIEKNIVVNLTLVDIKTGTVEKTFSKEYLSLDKELRVVAELSLKQLLGIAIDEKLLNTVTNENNFPNRISEQEDILKLNGPRFGMAFFTGQTANRFQAPRSEGGYNGAYPGVWQFGYQFEKQYLNTGDVQVLFEFIPMVNGLDQGMFNPSFTVLHGIRSNNTGLEFAFGPTLRFIKKSATQPVLDSNGKLYASSDFVFAFGRSFKSGRMNIPVNLFVVPNKNGTRFGFSFGFNVSNIKKK
jgi:hypothetical protein